MTIKENLRARHDVSGWSSPAVLRLLAVAVLWDRVIPTQSQPYPERQRSDRALSAVGRIDDDDRGRHAASPAEIPAKGWKDVLLRVYANISAHRILALAAGMTYYSILAIFPAIAALVALYGFFSDPMTIARHLDQLGGFLPGGAIDIAKEQLTRVASKGTQTLGLTFAIGLVTSLWSANAAMKSLFDTLNIVHGEEEKRGFFKLNALSLGFTVGGVAFILAALGSIVVVPVILSYVGLSDAGDLLFRIGRWPAMYLILTFALAVVYRYGASREAPNGAGSRGGARLQPCSGLALPDCSHGMPPTSVISMRPTARSAPSSAS